MKHFGSPSASGKRHKSAEGANAACQNSVHTFFPNKTSLIEITGSHLETRGWGVYKILRGLKVLTHRTRLLLLYHLRTTAVWDKNLVCWLYRVRLAAYNSEHRLLKATYCNRYSI